MGYIVKKSGKIINLDGYELEEETKDKYYFVDKKYNSAGITIKKADIVRYVK